MLLKPVYSQPYNEIVQPDVIWGISKYFIRRWAAYLTPLEVWLVVGARQLSYYNHDADWFKAYDRKLAKTACISLSQYQHHIKPAIAAGEGAISRFLEIKAQPTYERQGSVTRQTQTVYTIRRDDPLTPADAAYLGEWLRRHAPNRVTPAALTTLLEEARRLPSREFWSPTPHLPAAFEAHSVSDVVRTVFGCPAQQDAAWQKSADALHQHLTEAKTRYIDTQYLRRRWLPKLKHGPAWLLVYLRSFTYRDDTGTVRDHVDYYSTHVQRLFGIKDSKTLRNWIRKLENSVPDPERQPFPYFIQLVSQTKEPGGQVKRVYKVCRDDPLVAGDLKQYWEKVAALTEGKKCSHTDAAEGNIRSHTQTAEGKKCSHTTEGEGKNNSHTHAANGNVYSHTQGGEGNLCRGWEEKLQANKHYKHFMDLTAEKSTFIKAVSTSQQQHLWRAEDRQAGLPFAVVVTNLAEFPKQVDIHDPKGQATIRQSGWGIEEAVAWYLWGRDQSWMHNLAGYLIQRAREGAVPPEPYLTLAQLPWSAWRIYALYWQLPPDQRPDHADMAALPHFESWSLMYKERPPAGLPFDVGADMADLVDAIVDHGRLREEEVVAPADDAAAEAERDDHADGRAPEEVWRLAKAELELQMTKATFNAWLQDAYLLAYRSDTYFIGVRNEFAQKWIEARLLETIERTLSGIAGKAVTCAVEVREEA